MEQLKSIVDLGDLYMAMGLLVPGLIILFIRSQFVTDRRPSHSTIFLHYITVSLVYYAIALPFFHMLPSLSDKPIYKVSVWFALILFGPAILGLFLGINVQKNLLYRALQKCGLNLVHAIPTAWDWKFGNMTEQWVLVTLNDDTQFRGFCGQGSFISSDPTERDIYVEQVYDIDVYGNWCSPGLKGVFIAPSEIKTIEFWPYEPQENADEQS